MKQYCVYCSRMSCGDANYCSVKEKTYSDNSIKTLNKCKDFDFCRINALTMEEYKPKRTKKDKGQLSLFDME